jgi:hypothetical protein
MRVTRTSAPVHNTKSLAPPRLEPRQDETEDLTTAAQIVVARPPRLLLSREALVRLWCDPPFSEIFAAAVRTCVSMIHTPHGAGGRIPSCVLAVLRPNGAAVGSPTSDLEYLYDYPVPDSAGGL